MKAIWRSSGAIRRELTRGDYVRLWVLILAGVLFAYGDAYAAERQDFFGIACKVDGEQVVFTNQASAKPEKDGGVLLTGFGGRAFISIEVPRASQGRYRLSKRQPVKLLYSSDLYSSESGAHFAAGPTVTGSRIDVRIARVRDGLVEGTFTADMPSDGAQRKNVTRVTHGTFKLKMSD